MREEARETKRNETKRTKRRVEIQNDVSLTSSSPPPCLSFLAFAVPSRSNSQECGPKSMDSCLDLMLMLRRRTRRLWLKSLSLFASLYDLGVFGLRVGPLFVVYDRPFWLMGFFRIAFFVPSRRADQSDPLPNGQDSSFTPLSFLPFNDQHKPLLFLLLSIDAST